MGGGACDCSLKMGVSRGVRGCVSACRLDGGGVPLGVGVSESCTLASACILPVSILSLDANLLFDCFRIGS